MKGIHSKFLFVCTFIVICVQMAYADSEGSTFLDGNYIYRVISEDEYECELSDMRHEPSGFDPIPEEVNGYTVVSIADKAFRNYNGSYAHSSKIIRSPRILEFPPTIRNVGKYIFGQGYGYETSGLNTIIIHEGTEVSPEAFSDLAANLRCVYLLGETGLKQFNTNIDKTHEDCVLILPNDGRNFTNYSNDTGCFNKVAPYGFSAYYNKSKGWLDFEKRYDGPIIVSVGESIGLTAQSYPASYGKGMTVSVENTEILQENYAVRRETFNENSHYNCGIHSTTSFTCTNCMANGGEIGIFSYIAVKPGNTSITFSTADGTTKTFDVTVVEAKVKSIELSTDLDCAFAGETVHLSAKVLPENAIQAVKYEVNNGSQLGWTDLDDDKIEISPEWDGTVSKMRIRAKSSDGSDVISNICEVYICNMNKMHFREDSLTVGTGKTETNYLYFGNSSPSTVLHYKSEDENIAISDDEGHITGVSPGRTTISVYRKGCNIPIASFPVEVYVPVKSIELDRYEIHVPFHTYFTINAKVLPENATDKRISFYKNGYLEGHDNKWYICYPCNNSTEIEAHSVENPAIKAVCRIYQEEFQYGLSNLSSNKIYLSRGESITVEPFILPEYQNNRTWEYSSDNSDIAEIDQDGCITAKNIGTTTICVLTDSDGWRATIYKEVIVINKVSSISLNPSSVEGYEGEQIQISATVLPEDATNKMLAWGSSDESVATVDETGLISLLKKGTAVILASATDDSGASAECAVVVTEYSGIDSILTDKNTYVKVFNLSGVLVYEGIYSDANLAPGYYIVVCDGKNVKVKVE